MRTASVLLFAVAIMMIGSVAAGRTALQVKTDLGVVEGKTRGGINEFLGIPYAAPPVGDLRWKPPAPAEKWTGVRKATKFGARCTQGRIYNDMVFRDPGPSEDCLTLNVWVPADAKAKLPVMVWIYGGGFQAGATSEPRQEGHNLAKQGVVVVSMNYRLGIFGFFVHPELVAESPNKAAGNYGLLDQTAALAWVQRNIAGFGGDPGNVTMFGESAGSFSVSAQMASPLAKGLFQKAIGESGAAFSHKSSQKKTLAVRAEEDAKFAETELHARSLAELRAMPADKVLEASLKKKEGDDGFQFTRNVDGYFLPESPAAIFAAGKQNDVPLLAGWNRDEGKFSLEAGKSVIAAAKEKAEKDFGARAPEFLNLYSVANDAEALRSMSDYDGDDGISWSTWRWLEAQKTSGKQVVYRYRFDQSLPSKDKPEGLGHTTPAKLNLCSDSWIPKRCPSVRRTTS
jgi:para-nitrobenzyl esterase